MMASASGGCDTTCKTKRSALPLEKKLEIIAELRKGKSQRLDRFSLVSTVGDVWKVRNKIETHVSASGNPSFAKKRCIVRDPQFDNLDQACYLWFQEQRSKGAPVSGPVLQEKALQLFSSLHPDKGERSFKASSKLVLVGFTSFVSVIESGNYPFRVSHCQQTLQQLRNFAINCVLGWKVKATPLVKCLMPTKPVFGGKVITLFLPPNTTSILQPINQGILEALK